MRIRNSEDLGQLIREARQALGLRQKDVAAFSDCGERFIVDLENGKPTCQIGKALHVALMLGISFSAKVPTGDQVQGRKE
ncbi:MAG: helix-turn-helix domain-containing protein [Candidatus Obscuribacterales bacterium]|nr:helix-turn-helix domain-containing protein [Candidatus Obscuribacterales bacterium]